MSSQGSERISDQYTPRQKLAAMMIRAELDPDDYGAKLKADPVAALQSVGLSAPDARALIDNASSRAAEPGAALRGGCNDTTCYISLCPASCYATIPGIPGVCKSSPGCGIFSSFF